MDEAGEFQDWEILQNSETGGVRSPEFRREFDEIGGKYTEGLIRSDYFFVDFETTGDDDRRVSADFTEHGSSDNLRGELGFAERITVEKVTDSEVTCDLKGKLGVEEVEKIQGNLKEISGFEGNRGHVLEDDLKNDVGIDGILDKAPKIKKIEHSSEKIIVKSEVGIDGILDKAPKIQNIEHSSEKIVVKSEVGIDRILDKAPKIQKIEGSNEEIVVESEVGIEGIIDEAPKILKMEDASEETKLISEVGIEAIDNEAPKIQEIEYFNEGNNLENEVKIEAISGAAEVQKIENSSEENEAKIGNIDQMGDDGTKFSCEDQVVEKSELGGDSGGGVEEEAREELEKSMEKEKKKENFCWKLPFEVLKYCVCRVSPVWTFSVAAAVMGFVLLRRRFYKMKKKSRTLHVNLAFEDKKVSRFNEAISVVRRVPIIRHSLPAAGVSPWPMINLR